MNQFLLILESAAERTVNTDKKNLLPKCPRGLQVCFSFNVGCGLMGKQIVNPFFS